jgi:hypothetical protein
MSTIIEVINGIGIGYILKVKQYPFPRDIEIIHYEALFINFACNKKWERYPNSESFSCNKKSLNVIKSYNSIDQFIENNFELIL